MATLTMDTICGHVNKVTAKSDGKMTHVSIETTCPKIQKWGTEFDLPMEQIMDCRNVTLEEKLKTFPLTPTCFVPALVMNVVWMENGMISKSLVKKKSPVQIEYND
ncbi:MAG: hypothetical protein FWE54_03220 [Methanimicrococcus sp.]|nr:hypothetical protein [Methanimicrococcus sp.]